MPTSPAKTKRPTLRQSPEMCVLLRERAGLNQRTAAELIGKSPQLLADIEAGRRSATPEVLQAMAREYNCPLVGLEAKRWSHQ